MAFDFLLKEIPQTARPAGNCESRAAAQFGSLRRGAIDPGVESRSGTCLRCRARLSTCAAEAPQKGLRVAPRRRRARRDGAVAFWSRPRGGFADVAQLVSRLPGRSGRSIDREAAATEATVVAVAMATTEDSRLPGGGGYPGSVTSPSTRRNIFVT